MLRMLDLFSGIGGFTLAAQMTGGFETVCFVETDSYCQRVLRKHWPDIPIHDDVRTYTTSPGSVDVITAGFPCQDLSSAGKQAGLSGERSGLFYEIIRLLREIRPAFVVLENVANLVSHANGETFRTVLREIADAGFDAEWAVVSAKDVGACHLRKRVWIVAYTHDPRPQGLWAERELQEGGRQEQVVWRGGNRLSSDWRSYLSEPVLCLGDDGLSNRVDRLKALGNAVVPQCAVIALMRVKELSAGNAT